MKLRQLFLLAFALFSFNALTAQQSLPDANVKTLDGQVVNLLESYGQPTDHVTVFSFWATWCTPCKKELDAVADFYPDWQDEFDVEIVAITIDTRRAISKVPAMVETKGWEYTILAGDQQEMQSAFNFQTIPQTIVIGKDGKIAHVHNGYVPGDEEELGDIIAKLSK